MLDDGEKGRIEQAKGRPMPRSVGTRPRREAR